MRVLSGLDISWQTSQRLAAESHYLRKLVDPHRRIVLFVVFNNVVVVIDFCRRSTGRVEAIGTWAGSKCRTGTGVRRQSAKSECQRSAVVYRQSYVDVRRINRRIIDGKPAD